MTNRPSPAPTFFSALPPGLEKRYLHAMVEHLPFFFATADLDGNVTYLNKVAREWLTLTETGIPEGLRLPPPILEAARQTEVKGVWQQEREQFLQGFPGAIPNRTVLQTIVPNRDENGEVLFYSMTALDISEQKRHERERGHLLSIIQETPDAVATADSQGNLLYLNRAARTMLGIGLDEDITNLHGRDIRPEWAGRLLVEKALPIAAATGGWEGETAFLSRTGRQIPIWQIIVAHKNEAGEVEHFSAIIRDITDRKQEEARLQYEATHDFLTGAINRRHFEALLGQELERSRRLDVFGALLQIDLDKFKKINDEFGHHVGDDVLRYVVQTVHGMLRKTDVVGRLGGDEFAVLLPGATVDIARDVGTRLLRRLESEAPTVDGHTVRIRASIGIAMYPEDDVDTEQLLIRADRAMYVAKRHGGRRVAVYADTVQT